MSSIDPENPVVKLCALGMQAEAEGRVEDAKQRFAEAWDARTDDFEACVAAHYVARHQSTPEETLRWNQIAVDHADALADDRARAFFPSLYLCLGKSHEDLGNLTEAARLYRLAQARVGVLGGDSYGDLVRRGLAAARARMASVSP